MSAALRELLRCGAVEMLFAGLSFPFSGAHDSVLVIGGAVDSVEFQLFVAGIDYVVAGTRWHDNRVIALIFVRWLSIHTSPSPFSMRKNWSWSS